MPAEQRPEKKRRGIPSPFTVVRMVRLGMTVARTVGALGAFFTNPASLAILVPIGLFVLALFIILFGTGFTGAPAVPGAPGVAPTSQPIFPPGVASDCPVPAGKITTSSYQSDPVNGHCGTTYSYSCLCGTQGRRAKAVDVATNGQNVILPTIQGQQVRWKLILKAYPISAGEGGGWGHIFETILGTDKWYLDMLHLEQTGLIQGEEYPSGTPVAKSVLPWVHTTIGKNVVNPTSPASYATDCDPGWQATDFICR